jgi:hypothetical protein
MIKETFDMSENHESEQLVIDKYSSTINESVMLVVWSEVTGTLDGTVDLIGYLDSKDEESWGVIGTITINSESGRQLVYTGLDCELIQAVYSKKNISGGEMTIYLRGSE